MAYANSVFAKGQWEWSNEKKGIIFTSHKEVEAAEPQKQSIVVTHAAGCTHTDLVLNFLDTINSLEQFRFRRTIQRQVKPGDDEIITLQDVKDVVLFQVTSKLPPEFIDMIYTDEVDRFFRALIFYFQLFLQASDELSIRRIICERKIRQPNTIAVENVMRDNLADLRSMVAREYCLILLGQGSLQKYHHMSNKISSAPERDIRLFELLLRISVHLVWITLQRCNLHLIEQEMYRLFRSEEFSLTLQRNQSSVTSEKTLIEKRVLCGEKSLEIHKLLARSPAALEILVGEHDFRLLGVGIFQFDKKDERIQYLEAVYTVSENKLKNFAIPFGILGKPREDFDAMLVPLKIPEEDHDEKELCYKHLALSSLTYMMRDSKFFEIVKVPEGTKLALEIIPFEMLKKGSFLNKTSREEQEALRLKWKSIKT